MGRSLKPSALTEVLCPRLKQYRSVSMNVFLIQFLRICSKVNASNIFECNSLPVHCCVMCRPGYHHDLPIFGIYMFVQLFVLRMATRDFHKIPGAFGQGLSSAFLEDLTCSFFCSMCVLTQTIGQLWSRPEEVPGCAFDDAAAGLP